MNSLTQPCKQKTNFHSTRVLWYLLSFRNLCFTLLDLARMCISQSVILNWLAGIMWNVINNLPFNVCPLPTATINQLKSNSKNSTVVGNALRQFASMGRTGDYSAYIYYMVFLWLLPLNTYVIFHLAFTFGIIAVHVTPDRSGSVTVDEISSLVDVYDAVSELWRIQVNVVLIIVGTLGCVFIDNETHESGVTKCTTGFFRLSCI